MLRVKGAIGLPDSEDEMEELTHAVTDRDVAAFASGLEAAIEGADGGVVANGGPSGVPQVATHQIVAFARHVLGTGGQRVALLVDAGAVFFGKDSEIVDELLGRLE